MSGKSPPSPLHSCPLLRSPPIPPDCPSLIPPATPPATPHPLQASGLARRAISVYKTYIEMMNDDIKAAFNTANPFQFRHIAHLKSAAQFDDVGPCVVMATPSMLQARLLGWLARDGGCMTGWLAGWAGGEPCKLGRCNHTRLAASAPPPSTPIPALLSKPSALPPASHLPACLPVLPAEWCVS